MCVSVGEKYVSSEAATGEVLKRFAKFTGKYLCQSLVFNKIAGLRSTTLLKKDSGTGVFAKFLRTSFL